MKIFNSFAASNSFGNNGTKSYLYPNLKPLAHDTVSFGAMKKNQFQGIDLAVINRFKAPIDTFNSQDDFNDWCKERIEEITSTEYPARQDEATTQRKAMLKEWFDYVAKENGAYSPSIQLLIFDGITKDLDESSDLTPPVLNKGVLADTVSQILENVKNKGYQVNFNKLYQTNLQNFYLKDLEEAPAPDGTQGKGKTGWVIIPSKENDPENFEANVEKLKALSHQNWCTKSFNAEPYLSEGDFHVYLENGRPKLGVRFVGDEIEEIQGEKNNTKIPVQYLDTVYNHISDQDWYLSDKAQNELSCAEVLKEKISEIKTELKGAIESEDYETIFNYFDLGCTKNPDGTFTLEKFHEPSVEIYYYDEFDCLDVSSSETVTFKELGINENKLFANVKNIKTFANFTDSTISDISNLESIGESANFKGSNIKNPGRLKIKNKPWYLSEESTFTTNMKRLITDNIIREIDLIGKDNVEGIFELLGTDCQKNPDGTLTISRFKAPHAGLTYEELGLDENKLLQNVKKITGNADFRKTNIINCDSIEQIGGNAFFGCSKVESAKNLKSVGGDIIIISSKNIALDNLAKIGGNAFFENSSVKVLPALKKIGGNANFKRSAILTPNLEYIGKDANYAYSNIKSLEKLKEIGGNADFNHSMVSDTAELHSIDGNADFSFSKIKNLKNIEFIGGNAKLSWSPIENLGNLKTVKGNFEYINPKLKDLGSLETIEGNFICDDSEIIELFKDFVEIKGEVIERQKRKH